jgi:hypothetical protein
MLGKRVDLCVLEYLFLFMGKIDGVNIYFNPMIDGKKGLPSDKYTNARKSIGEVARFAP